MNLCIQHIFCLFFFFLINFILHDIYHPVVLHDIYLCVILHDIYLPVILHDIYLSVILHDIYLPVVLHYIYLPVILHDIYLPVILHDIYLPVVLHDIYLPVILHDIYLPVKPNHTGFKHSFTGLEHLLHINQFSIKMEIKYTTFVNNSVVEMTSVQALCMDVCLSH